MIRVLFVFLLSLLSLSVFAESGAVRTEMLNGQAIFANTVNAISFSFCNAGMEPSKFTRGLSLDSKRYQKQHLCGVISNSTDSSKIVSVSFVPASRTSDGLINCGTSGDPFFGGALFGWTGGKVILSGNSFQIINSSFLYTTSGDHSFCVVYSVEDPTAQPSQGMFDLVVRKVAPVTLRVSEDRYYLQWWDDAVSFVKENQKNVLYVFIGIILLALLWEFTSGVSNKKKK